MKKILLLEDMEDRVVAFQAAISKLADVRMDEGWIESVWLPRIKRLLEENPTGQQFEAANLP
jgi:hypothetical protein